MSKAQKIGPWFAAAAVAFFNRALVMSSWTSRGPEVQEALHINTVQMGLLSMLYPAGGLVGVLFASWFVQRFGSRIVNAGNFAIAGLGLVLLGPAVDSGNFALSAMCLVMVGLPMALTDYLGNFEGARVDKASKRSLFPAIHGAFGVGMLLGAAVASWLIDHSVSITVSFLWIGAFAAVTSILVGLAFPRREKLVETAKTTTGFSTLKAWGEKRSLLLAVIGFSFIMAEVGAGIWVPLALKANGYTGAEAAAAFGVFWIAITITRLIGGYLVDLIGRFRTVLFSAITTAVGMVVFITSQATGLPHLGLVLWGLGIALGFPMVVASMGDDQAKAAARVNMIITVVYISSISVGPALGALGQVTSIYVAFAIPLTMILISAALSKVTKPAV
jgi:fucose permease